MHKFKKGDRLVTKPDMRHKAWWKLEHVFVVKYRINDTNENGSPLYQMTGKDAGPWCEQWFERAEVQ